MPRWDVIVVGGGTAGACAAIAAGRQGAQTLCLEQFGFLGGSQTAALVIPMMSFRTSNEALIRGLNEEILACCEAFAPGQDGIWFDPETVKSVLETMALEAGVELLYHCQFAEPLLDGNRITGVYTLSKSGRRPHFARQVIDCSGDADVAFRAGAPCKSGREADGMNQAASLRFILGNVDLAALGEFLTGISGAPHAPPKLHFGFSRGMGTAPWIEALVDQAEAEGVLSPAEGGYVQAFSVPGRPGELAFNCPRITHVNGARAEDLTRCEILGRQRIRKVIEFCRRYLRGFEEAYLAWTAPMVGVRETRRIVGEYVLTAEDVLGARKFGDSIAKNRYPIDIHNPTGEGTVLRQLPPDEYHEVPYGCLVPLEIDNLLVAGRCISATFEAQGSLRIQANCRAFGEAAGVAAALCAKGGLVPRELDPMALIEVLRANGANV
ncbi:MAG: FAD-dependent oxidoreductase [Armatimonadetes bacterium]|nr:FAD-dependent oxidoreductase [Armatimonadota bacterium]